MHITPEILEMVRRFMAEQIPFNTFLGIAVETVEEGRVVLRAPFRPEFIGDAARPALHGGLISTLIDAAGGAAVWSRVTKLDRVSTIDLRVDYLQPGRAEALWADARVIRVGNRVGVATIRAFHPDQPDATIAEGKGVYNIKRGTTELR